MAGTTRKRRTRNIAIVASADRKGETFSSMRSKMKQTAKQKSTEASNYYWKYYSIVFSIVAFAFILAASKILYPLAKRESSVYDGHDSYSDNGQAIKNTKMNRFVTWFLKSGGYVAPNVKLTSFQGYGYGLLAINSSISEIDADVLIKEGDDLIVIPSKIQFNSDIILEQLHKYNRADIARSILQKTEKHISATNVSPLEVQDVILALALMVECSLGQDSEYFEYLSILPADVPPRLDSFSNEELTWLQDPMMQRLAYAGKKQMYQVWNDGLSSSVKDWAQAKQKSSGGRFSNTQGKLDESCFSFGSFHRFLAIVGSHAMVLDDGKKFIAPMADMINHAPRSTSETSEEYMDASFLDFHVRSTENGSITVKADRSVRQKQQIFEEYGKLDNSLYLMAHGFVVEDNPYHCVILPGDTLPHVTHSDLKQVLDRIHISNDLIIDGVCASKAGSIQGDENGLVTSYLAVAYLESSPSLRKECIDAATRTTTSEDVSLLKAKCTNFTNAEVITRNMIGKSAQEVISKAQTTLQNDLSLLEEYIEKGKISSDLHHGTDQTRVALALRFRIADKQILHAIARN